MTQFRSNVFLCLTILLSFSILRGEGTAFRYEYHVNLSDIQKNRYRVQLHCESFAQDTLVYHFPWIIPGTYQEANYGKYIHDLRAYDMSGSHLPVRKQGKNTFIITPANQIGKIEYWVSATWDSRKLRTIWPMAGTGIIPDRVFAINAGGVFGYFHGLESAAVDVKFDYPPQLYPMTVLDVHNQDPGSVQISSADYHELVDSPILFASPDTASFMIHGTDVLVAFAHETDTTVRASRIRNILEPSMTAIAGYLDELPAEEYAYLVYFANEYDLGKILDNPRFIVWKGMNYVLRNGIPVGGALEHNKSSFYYLPDPGPGYTENIYDVIESIAIHEFLHILTPLNLRSERIHDWDYNDPVMSKHLWLYEGVTEYLSEIIQANGGMKTPKEFISRTMQRKIRSGEKFPLEKMSFTEMSENVLERRYRKHYNQVYQRGAVMGMLLDIEIIRLTEGRKRLIDVMTELIAEYGPTRPMDEEEVFQRFTEKVHPDLMTFFDSYVSGRVELPYQEILAHVGVRYTTDSTLQVPKHPVKDRGGKYSNISMGGDLLIKKMKKNSLGLQAGDKIDPAVYLDHYFDDFGLPLPEGMPVKFTVRRDSEEVTITDRIEYKPEKVSYNLSIMREMTPQQSRYFNIWLGFEEPIRD